MSNVHTAQQVAHTLEVFGMLWSQLAPTLPRSGVLNHEELPLEDPWEPDVGELNLLMRPFMERAGLDDWDVFVELWDGDEKLRGLPDQNKGRPRHGPAIWFDSVVEGLCIFSAERTSILDQQATVASAASAVAAAFLTHQLGDAEEGLRIKDEDEVRVWEIVAVMLGFVAVQLPRPALLNASSLLAVTAQVCRLGMMDPAQIELAIAPRFHPLFARYLINA